MTENKNIQSYQFSLHHQLVDSTQKVMHTYKEILKYHQPFEYIRFIHNASKLRSQMLKDSTENDIRKNKRGELNCPC